MKIENLNNHITQEHERVIQNTIDKVRSYFKPSQRSVYYPSSGSDICRVFDLRADSFFFSDQVHFDLLRILKNQIPEVRFLEQNDLFAVFESSGKRGYFFYMENNIALEIIRELNPHLDYFVGVRDGCFEGGNFECVNDPPFLQKVVDFCPPEGMSIYIDHSIFLDKYPEYIFGNKRIYFVEFLPQKFNNFPMGETRHYRVTHHIPVVHEWKRGNIRLTIEFDNILNHVEELDGIVGSCACRRRAIEENVFKRRKYSIQHDYFFRPDERPSWSADKSLIEVLSVIEEKNWSVVGVTAFGQEDHKNFLNILLNYDPAKPVWLRFFHIDSGDFRDLIKLMSQ